MYISYTTQYEEEFAVFDTREEAVAWALRNQNDNDPDFWDDGRTIKNKGKMYDYMIAVYPSIKEALSSMQDGDQYSLPNTLRAFAKALEG